MIKKSAFLLACSVLLTACGGGGSSDSNSGPVVSQPPSTPNTYTFSMEDDTQSSFDLGVEFDDLVSDVSDDVASVSISGGGITVNAKDVDREHLVRVELYQGDKVKGYVVISISNSDAAQAIAQAKSLVESKDAILEQEEAFKVFAHFADVAYLSERLSNSEKDQLIASFTPSDSGHYSDVAQAINDVAAALAGYQAGGLSDSDLAKAISSAEEHVSSHSAQGSGQLASLQEVVGDLMPEFPATAISYRAQLDEYSRFEGNSDFGSFDSSGNFVYLDQFEILAEFNLDNESSIFCPL